VGVSRRVRKRLKGQSSSPSCQCPDGLCGARSHCSLGRNGSRIGREPATDPTLRGKQGARFSPSAGSPCFGRGAPARDDTRVRRPGACRRPHRGRKRAQTSSRGRTSLDRPERGRADPPPPGRPSGRARPVRGRRAADAPTQSGCSISASRRRRHGRPQPAVGAPVEPGATTRSPCLLHGLLPASPQGPRELRARATAAHCRGRRRVDRHACSSWRLSRKPPLRPAR